jgi:hypothetical protein
MSAGQQSDLRCGAGHFSQSASTLQSGDTGLSLKFGQRVLKERQEIITHATIITKTAGRMFVCSSKHQVVPLQ